MGEGVTNPIGGAASSSVDPAGEGPVASLLDAIRLAACLKLVLLLSVSCVVALGWSSRRRKRRRGSSASLDPTRLKSDHVATSTTATISDTGLTSEQPHLRREVSVCEQHNSVSSFCLPADTVIQSHPDKSAGDMETDAQVPDPQPDSFFTWDSGGGSGEYSFVHTAVELPKYPDGSISEEEKQMLLLYMQSGHPELLLTGSSDPSQGVTPPSLPDNSLCDPTAARGFLETIIEENSDDLRSPSECDETSVGWGSWDESDDDRDTVVEVQMSAEAGYEPANYAETPFSGFKNNCDYAVPNQIKNFLPDDARNSDSVQKMDYTQFSECERPCLLVSANSDNNVQPQQDTLCVNNSVLSDKRSQFCDTNMQSVLTNMDNTSQQEVSQHLCSSLEPNNFEKLWISAKKVESPIETINPWCAASASDSKVFASNDAILEDVNFSVSNVVLQNSANDTSLLMLGSDDLCLVPSNISQEVAGGNEDNLMFSDDFKDYFLPAESYIPAFNRDETERTNTDCDIFVAEIHPACPERTIKNNFRCFRIGFDQGSKDDNLSSESENSENSAMEESLFFPQEGDVVYSSSWLGDCSIKKQEEAASRTEVQHSTMADAPNNTTPIKPSLSDDTRKLPRSREHSASDDETNEVATSLSRWQHHSNLQHIQEATSPITRWQHQSELNKLTDEPVSLKYDENDGDTDDGLPPQLKEIYSSFKMKDRKMSRIRIKDDKNNNFKTVGLWDKETKVTLPPFACNITQQTSTISKSRENVKEEDLEDLELDMFAGSKNITSRGKIKSINDSDIDDALKSFNHLDDYSSQSEENSESEGAFVVNKVSFGTELGVLNSEALDKSSENSSLDGPLKADNENGCSDNSDSCPLCTDPSFKNAKIPDLFSESTAEEYSENRNVQSLLLNTFPKILGLSLPNLSTEQANDFCSPVVNDSTLKERDSMSPLTSSDSDEYIKISKEVKKRVRKRSKDNNTLDMKHDDSGYVEDDEDDEDDSIEERESKEISSTKFLSSIESSTEATKSRKSLSSAFYESKTKTDLAEAKSCSSIPQSFQEFSKQFEQSSECDDLGEEKWNIPKNLSQFSAWLLDKELKKINCRDEMEKLIVNDIMSLREQTIAQFLKDSSNFAEKDIFKGLKKGALEIEDNLRLQPEIHDIKTSQTRITGQKFDAEESSGLKNAADDVQNGLYSSNGGSNLIDLNENIGNEENDFTSKENEYSTSQTNELNSIDPRFEHYCADNIPKDDIIKGQSPENERKNNSIEPINFDDEPPVNNNLGSLTFPKTLKCNTLHEVDTDGLITSRGEISQEGITSTNEENKPPIIKSNSLVSLQNAPTRNSLEEEDINGTESIVDKTHHLQSAANNSVEELKLSLEKSNSNEQNISSITETNSPVQQTQHSLEKINNIISSDNIIDKTKHSQSTVNNSINEVENSTEKSFCNFEISEVSPSISENVLQSEAGNKLRSTVDPMTRGMRSEEKGGAYERCVSGETDDINLLEAKAVSEEGAAEAEPHVLGSSNHAYLGRSSDNASHSQWRLSLPDKLVLKNELLINETQIPNDLLSGEVSVEVSSAVSNSTDIESKEVQPPVAVVLPHAKGDETSSEVTVAECSPDKVKSNFVGEEKVSVPLDSCDVIVNNELFSIDKSSSDIGVKSLDIDAQLCFEETPADFAFKNHENNYTEGSLYKSSPEFLNLICNNIESQPDIISCCIKSSDDLSIEYEKRKSSPNRAEYQRSQSAGREPPKEDDESDTWSGQSKSTPDLRRCHEQLRSSVPLSALLSKSVSQRIEDYLGHSARGDYLHRSLPPQERSRHYRRICVSTETVVEKAARFEARSRNNSSRPVKEDTSNYRSGSCPPLNMRSSLDYSYRNYSKPTAAVRPTIDARRNIYAAQNGKMVSDSNSGKQKEDLLELITGYSKATKVTHKPPVPPASVQPNQSLKTIRLKGKIASARKEFFERLSQQDLSSKESGRKVSEEDEDPHGAPLRRFDEFRRSAREERARLAASHPDLGALEAAVRSSKRRIDQIRKKKKSGAAPGQAPLDAGPPERAMPSTKPDSVVLPYRRCTGEIAWASCSQRLKEAKARGRREPLEIADVRAHHDHRRRPGTSGDYTDEEEEEEESAHSNGYGGDPAIAAGEFLGSRARSMDFLLDADNRERAQPPENRLSTGQGRVKSEHELRIERSLQNLTIPDWYKQSAWSKKPKEGFILRRGSEGSAGESRKRWLGFSSSRTPSATSLTTPPSQYSQRHIVVPKRVTPTSGEWRYVGSLVSSRESLTPASPASLSPRECSSAAFQYGLNASLSRWSSSRLSTSSAPLTSLSVHRSFRQPYLGWRAAAASSSGGGSRSSPGVSPVTATTPVQGSRPGSPRRGSQEHHYGYGLQQNQITSASTLRPEVSEPGDSSSRISPLALYDNSTNVFFNSNVEAARPDSFEQQQRFGGPAEMRRDRYSYTQSLYCGTVIVSPGAARDLEDDCRNFNLDRVPRIVSSNMEEEEDAAVRTDERFSLVRSPQPPPRIWMESSFVGTKKDGDEPARPVAGRSIRIVPSDSVRGRGGPGSTCGSTQTAMGEYVLRDFRRFGITL
ncbi:uncharacterized protein LOC129224847 [Uloborus diversus]|uniref:uncharacterized protein LOC129224847 n=1 Tax=Uloborus diversus TaxID=327109 RepID=UPI002409C35B|nr:uncharacterized protein LOC129224847 [Uloborus diversus]